MSLIEEIDARIVNYVRKKNKYPKYLYISRECRRQIESEIGWFGMPVSGVGSKRNHFRGLTVRKTNKGHFYVSGGKSKFKWGLEKILEQDYVIGPKYFFKPEQCYSFRSV